MKNEELKYFAYCRKSSEDAKKQVASIGDQTSTVMAMVERDSLNLVCPAFTEEKSAKQPGRLVFNEMLNRIEKGEANAIVCWAINRLIRNPVDEGRLRWMLQKGVIRVIKTATREYTPDDAGLLMGVEGGQATDYVIRLSKDTKRGLYGKVRNGWRPSPAPIGYLNVGEIGDKTIIADPDKFTLVRQMWDLFLTGAYPVSKIRGMANDKWGLRTLVRRKLGGKPLSMSHMYNIFNDPFYYGYFWWNDEETGIRTLVKGKHPAMITEKEFMRAQILLGGHGHAQPHTREFAFTGLVRCGECSSMITAEEKNQIICTSCKSKFGYENKTACPKCNTDISDMTHPTILNYVYYRCTKKKNRACTQKYIRLEDFEKQFSAVLNDLKIDDDYFKVALDYLNEKQKTAGADEKSARESLQKAYDDNQTRLNNLHREYTSPQNAKYELYTSDEFRNQKGVLVAEQKRIEKELATEKERLDQTHELSERTFNFCVYALHHFNKGTLQQKKEIFSSIGSNLILKDKIISIEALQPYMLIENQVKEQQALFAPLEPEKRGYKKEKEAIFIASLPAWLRG